MYERLCDCSVVETYDTVGAEGSEKEVCNKTHMGLRRTHPKSAVVQVALPLQLRGAVGARFSGPNLIGP